MNLLLPSKYGIPDISFDINILTKREVEILRRSLLQDKNIAWDLDISPNTVSTHLKNIRLKTGLQDRGQMGYYVCARQEQLFNQLLN